MESMLMWDMWQLVTSRWLFPAFMTVASAMVLLLWIVGAVRLLRLALLNTLELAVIVEAAREAKRQDRAPILRAWTRLDKRWRDG